MHIVIEEAFTVFLKCTKPFAHLQSGKYLKCMFNKSFYLELYFNFVKT